MTGTNFIINVKSSSYLDYIIPGANMVLTQVKYVLFIQANITHHIQYTSLDFNVFISDKDKLSAVITVKCEEQYTK